MIVTPRSRIVSAIAHSLAQLDIDACRGFIEKQQVRLVRQSLGDQYPALHPAGQGHDVVALVPQAERPQDLDPVRSGQARTSRAAAYRAMDGFEHVGAEFWNQADTTACAA